ncbi:thioredoxin [Streptomyces sp. NPDC020379]|uniref:thioredoxin n=1 Tax=Streptomyces sp. NPDC020379 TaxID=3365071 RepID=UPI0037B376FC
MTTTTGHASTTSIPSVTDDTFATEVLASELPVLVDFTAAWCAPCRMITPVLAELARQEASRIKVVQLDVDANPRTRAAYGVLSMPTLLLFRAGTPVRSLIGARPLRRLRQDLAAELPWIAPE